MRDIAAMTTRELIDALDAKNVIDVPVEEFEALLARAAVLAFEGDDA